ncbi:MAG: outer membrane protein [Planctomycetota bacterium]|jgi:opacity protein-like surface antigen
MGLDLKAIVGCLVAGFVTLDGPLFADAGEDRAPGRDREATPASDALVGTGSLRLELDPSLLVAQVSTQSVTGAALSFSGQDDPPQQEISPPPQSDWRLDLYLAGWIPLEFRGDFTIDSKTSRVNLDLDTILDDLEAIFESGVEITNDEWSVVIWGLYVELETDVKTETFFGEFDTDLDAKLGIVDAVVARRIGEWPLVASETGTWSLDVLGGFRYWSVDIEVKEKGFFGIDPSGSEKDDWVDPLVGWRILFDISEKFDASLRADIGGFRIGSAADLTWSVTAVGRFRFTPNVGLIAGYRYLDQDWSSGGGSTEYDFYIHGPIVGLSIKF